MKSDVPKSTTSPQVQHSPQPFFQSAGGGAFFPTQAAPNHFGPSTIQPKLTIGAPDDQYEKEADAMGERVVQMSSMFSATGSNPNQVQTKPDLQKMGEEQEEEKVQTKPDIQLKCAACEEEEEQVQMKSNGGESTASPDLASKLSAKSGSGQPLPADTQALMGHAIGADFSAVRVHTDSDAVQMNRELSAHAFTHGRDVYFNAGKYEPETTEGRRLLGHELGHVVQQSKNTIRRDPADAQTTEPDNETLLGKNLLDNFVDGINIAIYEDGGDEVFKTWANAWAKDENAIGFKRKMAVDNIVFGKAIGEKDNDISPVTSIVELLQKAASKAAAFYKISDNTNASKIKTLAYFSHGTTEWCSVSSISGTPTKTIKTLAPKLKNDVVFIIYACNVARSPDEEEDWYKGTLKHGGKDSLGFKIKNLLIENKITEGRVWGHTTTGAAPTNFALRYFDTKHGKDTVGLSYVSEYVFTPYDEFLTSEKVKAKLISDGYDIGAFDTSVSSKFRSYISDKLSKPDSYSPFYKCYAEANAKLTYNGRNLAQAIPVHPVEVAKIINEYWDKTYWPKVEGDFIAALIKKFKLKKVVQ